MSHDASDAQIMQQIERAFADVQLGEGVSLRETLALDAYWPEDERRAARALDEKLDWRKIVDDPELARLAYIGGLSFYDPEGMRFHLPAYLVLAIRDFERLEASNVLEVLMHKLCTPGPHNREQFSLLSPEQRRCVGAVLAQLRAKHELQSPELDDAVQRWLSAECGDDEAAVR